MQRVKLMIFGTIAAAATACGGGGEPDAGPSDGGYRVQGAVSVATGADTYPIAIHPSGLKVAYAIDSKLAAKDLPTQTALDANEVIDRRFAPLFDVDWHNVAFVKSFDDSSRYELSTSKLAGESTSLSLLGRSPLARSGEGALILYLASGSGTTELWSLELATSMTKKVGARASFFHVVDGTTKVVYGALGDEGLPGELHVADLGSGDDQRVADFVSIEHAGEGASKLLFFSAPGTLNLLDALTPRVYQLATDASESGGNAEVSADQTHAIFAREEITGRALYMIDTSNPVPVKIFAYTEEARIARDGKSVLLWTYRGPANLFIWTGRPQADLINRDFFPINGPVFDESMKHIAYFAHYGDTTSTAELRYYDVGARRDVMIEPVASAANVRIASDGSRVAFYRGADPTYAALSMWDSASGEAQAIAMRATRQLIHTKDLSVAVFAEGPTGERVSMWTARNAAAPIVLAEHGDLSAFWFDPSERRIAFANNGDLWLDVLDDTSPPALFAAKAGEAPVLTDSLIAYSVRAGTSTASGVYIAPLP